MGSLSEFPKDSLTLCVLLLSLTWSWGGYTLLCRCCSSKATSALLTRWGAVLKWALNSESEKGIPSGQNQASQALDSSLTLRHNRCDLHPTERASLGEHPPALHYQAWLVVITVCKLWSLVLLSGWRHKLPSRVVSVSKWWYRQAYRSRTFSHTQLLASQRIWAIPKASGWWFKRN